MDTSENSGNVFFLLMLAGATKGGVKHRPTPQSIKVNVEKELSGEQWCSRFPGSIDTDDLEGDFRTNCKAFIASMKEAGMKVAIGSTYRTRERAYLMHWAYMIKRGTDPKTVPWIEGVNIEWVHDTPQESKAAADAMCTKYKLDDLRTPPALSSLHMTGEAIDMNISWNGNVTIVDVNGNNILIDSLPRTGMNSALADVGKSYGVIKFVGGNLDKPHWSTTGH